MQTEKCYPEAIFHPAKFDNVKDEKISDYKTVSVPIEPKTYWNNNSWSSGIMSNFLGQFFYVLGGKTFFKFFSKYQKIF